MQKLAIYLLLINGIQMLGWKVAPLIVISAGIRGTTYNPSIQTLQTKIFKKETLININTIAIQHLSLIILHKCRLKNNQPLPASQ
jgi:hypothetical protein